MPGLVLRRRAAARRRSTVPRLTVPARQSEEIFVKKKLNRTRFITPTGVPDHLNHVACVTCCCEGGAQHVRGESARSEVLWGKVEPAELAESTRRRRPSFVGWAKQHIFLCLARAVSASCIVSGYIYWYTYLVYGIHIPNYLCFGGSPVHPSTYPPEHLPTLSPAPSPTHNSNSKYCLYLPSSAPAPSVSREVWGTTLVPGTITRAATVCADKIEGLFLG